MSMPTQRLSAVLFLILVVGPASLGAAEEVLLRDGTRVIGSLIRLSRGLYEIRVGDSVRRIPLGQVLAIQPEGAPVVTSAEAAASDAAAQKQDPTPPRRESVPSSSAADRGRAAQRTAPPLPQGLTTAQLSDAARRLGVSTDLLTAPLPEAGRGPGLGGVSMQQVQQILAQLGIDGKRPGPSTPGAALTLQTLIEQASRADPAQLRALQNNPMMNEIVARFKDPAYQKQLMDSLTMPGSRGAPDPRMDQIRALFNQLNGMGTSSSGRR